MKDVSLSVDVEFQRLNEYFLRLRAQGVIRKDAQLKPSDVDLVAQCLGLEQIKNLTLEEFLSALLRVDERKKFLRKRA